MSGPIARRLGVPTASLLVVASMIGTGVFTTTGFLVRDVGSLPVVLLAWGVGGVVALAGALVYGELSSAIPVSGGEYALLGRIYHPALGFLAGFVSFVVGFSAPAAASSLAFGHYLAAIFPGVSPVAAALVLLVSLSLLHALDLRVSTGVQNAFTVGKIVLVAAFAAAGLALGSPAHLLEGGGPPLADAALSSGFAVGLVYVSFTYSGWNAAAYVAGEVRSPGRGLPLSLVGGTLVVVVLYLALNLAFLFAAPPEALSGVVEVGHVAAVSLLGEGAGRVVSGLVALGLVSTVGALVVTGPRIYEQMGRDHPRLALLARRRAGGGPVVAIVLQALAAAAMIATASFDALLTYIGVTLSLFTGLTVAGVLVLRRRRPDLPRPYRTWGYPVTPFVFLALETWIVVHALLARPLTALAVGATLLAGAVLWLLVRERPSPPAQAIRS